MKGLFLFLSATLLSLSCKVQTTSRVLSDPNSQAASQLYEILSLQETAIKEQPLQSSDSRVGIVCRIPSNTRVVIRGTANFDSSGHAQVTLVEIGGSGNLGNAGSVPAPNSPPDYSSAFSDNPNATNGFQQSPATLEQRAVPQDNSCGLLGRPAYVYAAHFSGLENAVPPLEAQFQDYDPAWGQRIAAEASRSVGRDCGYGQCYACVGIALEHALGYAPNWGALNAGQCARSFSDFWNPSVHERVFRLRKIPTSDRSILARMPVGSIYVTGRCGRVASCPGGPGYGDIGVKVDESGRTASFYFASINSGCPASAPLLAVFIPIR